jgi:hypothetical protein
LNQTDSKRIVHFVANISENDIKDKLSFGSESLLIGGLTTMGTDDAYWQRVEFPNGIYGTEDADGVIIVASEVAALMKKVPLVRNFAKITVTEDLNNFEFEGFAVLNTPDRGSVAPYLGGKFADYVNDEDVCFDYSELLAQGYNGFSPSGMTLTNTAAPGEFNTAAKYMYERRFSTDRPTCIIVKGKYGNDGASTYYKIDLGKKDAEGEFVSYNILRNFVYAVTIQSVNGSGKATVEEAINAVAFNNIYTSTDLQSLLNISNGTDRLFVNFTNRILVSDAAVELKYKYLNAGTSDNGSIKTDMIKTGDVIASVGSVTGPDADGYNTITFTPNTPPANGNKKQSIRLYVQGGLSRTIELTLCAPWVMNSVVATPTVGTEIGTAVGTEVKVSFDIAADMSEYMFPLEFKLKADKGNLYNNPANADAMVVWYEVKTFGFTKLLTYEAYSDLTINTDGYKTIVCSFLTNKAAEAGDETMVYITNPYFTPKEVTFTQE